MTNCSDEIAAFGGTVCSSISDLLAGPVDHIITNDVSFPASEVDDVWDSIVLMSAWWEFDS